MATFADAMYRLRIFHDGRHRLASLDEAAVTLGAAGDNDVVLGEGVPALALRMALAQGGYTVRSASPQARPLVNGKPGEGALLQIGDRLELGPFAMILEAAEGEAEAAGPSTAVVDPGLGENLSKLCAWVAEERDLKALLEKAMKLLLEAFSADEAFLFHLDGGGSPRVFVSTHPGRDEALFSDTVVDQVLKARKGLRVANALADPSFAGSQSINDLRLHSVLCCPILAAGRLSGLVYLGSKKPAVSFSEAQLRALEAYAMVIGCLVNHVAFIAEQGKVIAALRSGEGESGVVAACPAMKKVLDEARAVAEGDISVLLQGETGTGKDVVANLIHRKSRRRDKPFLVVNCSTLRGELLASELFGHRKGAFTGALQDQKGLFVAADGGTLFLDEIGEMEPQLQAMLLRTLETGKVRPIGQTGEVQTDVRVVCATNRDLKEMSAKGTFRSDLYYRVNQHAIHLPPLRERGDDVLLLARHYLEKAKAQYPHKRIEGFHPDSLSAVSRYAWPGNVRELANAVNKAVLFADGPLVRMEFQGEGGVGGDPQAGRWLGFDDAVRRFQSDYLLKALASCEGDNEKAAAMLGMKRSTFFRYLSQARGEKSADEGE